MGGSFTIFLFLQNAIIQHSVLINTDNSIRSTTFSRQTYVLKNDALFDHSTLNMIRFCISYK